MNDLQGAQRNRPEGQTVSDELWGRRVMNANSFAQRAAQARREREAKVNEDH